MSISLKKSSRFAALGIALVVAPLLLKSTIAAERESESELTNESLAEPGNEPNDPALTSPVPASVIAAPLIRAGLSAEALSAVGVPSNQVATVLGAAVQEWQADPDRLPDAGADYATYRQQSGALRRKIRAGKASDPMGRFVKTKACQQDYLRRGHAPKKLHRLVPSGRVEGSILS